MVSVTYYTGISLAVHLIVYEHYCKVVTKIPLSFLAGLCFKKKVNMQEIINQFKVGSLVSGQI